MVELPPLKEGMFRWFPEDWDVSHIPYDPIKDVIKCNCAFMPQAKGMINTMIKNAPPGDS